ncbi:VC0807 family protein [Actinopolymorpha alba]|uniref:VC0807 family protein n=1 Tax=Actinopolymorpha alba TaxID=533267 RepID=UPI000364CECE|nr:VC0807 family protein [Actinopolymorpha alba]
MTMMRPSEDDPSSAPPADAGTPASGGGSVPTGAANAVPPGRPAGGGAAGIPKVFLSLLWDIGPSIAAYYGCRALGASTYVSLLVGTLVAGVRVAYVALRARRFDAFAAFMVATFGIGLVLSFLTGDEQFLVAKESFGTAAAGLGFLGSCVVGRPLTFYAAQRFSAATTEARDWWERMWATVPGFRRTFLLTSVVWGVTLLVEAAVRIVLAYSLPVDVVVGISPILGIGTFALLITWTVWYARRAQAQGEARARAAGQANG